jgi:hypothetical protein
MDLDLVTRPGEGVDMTLIRERLRMNPRDRVRTAELEWARADAFRNAVRGGP